MFAFWIILTYFTARNQNQAYDYFIEYIKIFAMMAVSMILLCTFDQLYCLLLIAAITLGYIAYEVNYLYLSTGYMGIY